MMILFNVAQLNKTLNLFDWHYTFCCAWYRGVVKVTVWVLSEVGHGDNITKPD